MRAPGEPSAMLARSAGFGSVSARSGRGKKPHRPRNARATSSVPSEPTSQ
jgi:hypothetical protein